jgi:phage baseplate assembly protein gpV/phage protein D
MSLVASLPRIDVELDGESLAEAAAATLEEVRVQHRLSQPSACELTFFLNRDPIPDLQNLRAGSGVRLTLPSSSACLFAGEITALEHSYEAAHGQTLRVRCYDKLHRLRKRQPVRVHVQVTAADLARELVADLGLAVDADEEGPLSQSLIQYRQSDLELLVEVSRRFGLYLTLRGDVLHLIGLEGIGDSIGLELGKNLLEARVEVNAEPACRSVLVKGWDASRVEPHESRAESARIGREVGAEAPPGRFGSSGERTLAEEVLPDDRHAAAVAQAELDLRSAREVTLWGVAEVDPDLMPGTRVQVSGIASGLAGRYVLTAVTHVVNRRDGFVSEISTVPPVFERRPWGVTAAWATVTSVDDPEKLGRVRASLPALGKVETDWMGVMVPGAGSGKGFVFLPDRGDQVLVLFVGGEVTQGIVLGGLYGTNDPGDYGVEGTSIRRFTLGTPGGQKIKLDDTGQSIRLENKGGSFLEFSPDKALLHSVVDLEIEAPGRGVVIKGKTIDFRQA